MAKKPNLVGVGLALGAALGTVFGVLAGHIAIWLATGVAIGMVLGASLHRNVSDCPECAMVHQGHQAKEQSKKLGANS